MSKKIVKIVITGGPCAGKTTSMSVIQKELSKKNWKVLFLPETATELITAGIAPWTAKTNGDFQKYLMRLQIFKERIFEQAAEEMKDEKILIVCDRGLLDNKIYMTDEEFNDCLKELDKSEVELRDNYDGVFHLVTAANGAVDFYTTANNSARTETPEQAIEIDNGLINSWTGHPHLRVIDNSSDFGHKLDKLIQEIYSLLGEPTPFEIERKFLIKYPNLEKLTALPYCKKVNIIQTYLVDSGDFEERRIRQRGENGNYVYYETAKKRITKSKRVEVEKRLTEREYIELLMEADITRGQIRKDRYCLTYNNLYYEIDVYPFWKDKAIMEIELKHEKDTFEIPEFIQVIKEVTGDSQYYNYNIAETLKK